MRLYLGQRGVWREIGVKMRLYVGQRGVWRGIGAKMRLHERAAAPQTELRPDGLRARSAEAVYDEIDRALDFRFVVPGIFGQ